MVSRIQGDVEIGKIKESSLLKLLNKYKVKQWPHLLSQIKKELMGIKGVKATIDNTLEKGCVPFNFWSLSIS